MTEYDCRHYPAKVDEQIEFLISEIALCRRRIDHLDSKLRQERRITAVLQVRLKQTKRLIIDNGKWDGDNSGTGVIEFTPID